MWIKQQIARKILLTRIATLSYLLYLLENKSLAALPRSANDGAKDISVTYNSRYESKKPVNQLVISSTI